MIVTKQKIQSGYFPEQRFPEKARLRTGRSRTVHEAPKKETVQWGNPTFYALLLCVLLVSVGLITQYSRVVAVKLQIHQVNREIAELQDEREHLRIEVKRLSSLERIEMIAKNELGPQYPEKDSG